MRTSQSTQRSRMGYLVALVLAATVMVAWLESAARAEDITDDNVAAAVAAAKTPADHQALAAYFTTKAEAAQANIEKHEKMAKAFSGKSQTVMSAHCESLVRSDKQLVKEYTALAKAQAALAK